MQRLWGWTVPVLVVGALLLMSAGGCDGGFGGSGGATKSETTYNVQGDLVINEINGNENSQRDDHALNYVPPEGG